MISSRALSILPRTAFSLNRVANTKSATQANFLIKNSSARHFRSGTVKRITENKQKEGFSGLLEADNSLHTLKVHHLSNLGMLALAPTAVILSPSILNVPVDYLLAVAIPVHSHIGMNGIFSDYVPKVVRPFVRFGWLGVSSVMFLGLMALNISGLGITATIKSFWKEPIPKKE